MPATISTDVGTVSCLVSDTTGRAFLARIYGVYLLYFDTKTLCFVGNEHRELIEAPTVLHAVVFAGVRPTTCACRALAYPLQGFNLDRAHTLFMRMVHDLSGQLVVDILPPPAFLALALLDGACFLGLLYCKCKSDKQ